MTKPIEIGQGWGVLAVDIQNDFVSGSLAVHDGEQVIDPMNKITDLARRRDVPIAMSADWHPRETKHFAEFGGKWPVHCVEKTQGAAFDPRLNTQGAQVFHKGMSTEDDGYSPWEGISAKGETLEQYLDRMGVSKLIVGGLATDYCVKAGVLDALKKRKWLGGHVGPRKYQVYLVEDAIRAVDVQPADGQIALKEMHDAGARLVNSRRFAGIS